jgi:hypothetical protein
MNVKWINCIATVTNIINYHLKRCIILHDLRPKSEHYINANSIHHWHVYNVDSYATRDHYPLYRTIYTYSDCVSPPFVLLLLLAESFRQTHKWHATKIGCLESLTNMLKAHPVTWKLKGHRLKTRDVLIVKANCRTVDRLCVHTCRCWNAPGLLIAHSPTHKFLESNTQLVWNESGYIQRLTHWSTEFVIISESVGQWHQRRIRVGTLREWY